MIFTSIEFLIFLPIVFSLFYITPYQIRWALLLLSSYIFYMWWKPEYILLIVFSTFIDYYAGLKMGSLQTKQERFPYLLVSLCSNLGLLFLFKYYNFFAHSIEESFSLFGVMVQLPENSALLPVGISFYTFQTLSYSIEVYQGNHKPEKHLGVFSLYVAFFPQLVAGPIERSSHLLPQFYRKTKFQYKPITNGMKLIAWGFFKKLVIADRAAIFVNQVYQSPQDFNGIVLVIATYLFAFQIYCDFSAYSDIAKGCAQMIGIDLMKNFDRPYFSQSIAEFWRRWHISLSTWFRDYVYIPLGGSKTSKTKFYRNIAAVFLLSGLWHGANWTFVIWGALHALYMITSILTKSWREKLAHLSQFHRIPYLVQSINIFITFQLVCLAWIFFRAQSLSDALFIVTNLHNGWYTLLSNITQLGQGMGILGGNFLLTKLDALILILAIAFMETIHLFQSRISIREWIAKQHWFVRWLIYYAALFSILNFGVFGEKEFIYFQF